jgi:SNF2 family DNA or RNA helicase
MEQARARIYRIGQTDFCTYYHLIATGTVDEVFYENNINKTDMIEDFKNRFGGI